MTTHARRFPSLHWLRELVTARKASRHVPKHAGDCIEWDVTA